MHLPAHRQRIAKRLLILVLVMSCVGFSVWLKMLPNLGVSLRAHAPASVKLWVDPSHDSDGQVKLALLGTVLLLVIAIPALVSRSSRPMQPIQARKFVARDIFSESRHWFRPPPLF